MLFVNASGHFAGAEAMLVDLTANLDRKRWDPLVLVPFAGRLAEALSRAGVEVQVQPLAVLANRRQLRSPAALGRLAGALPCSALRLARLARRRGAALVHSNSSALLDGALAARLAGIPHVWHVRETIPQSPLFRALFGRAALGLSSSVLCISRAVRAQFGRLADDPRLRIVHDGLDTRRFVATRPREEVRRSLGLDGAPAVGMVTRITPRKGQAAFLDAARLLSRAFPTLRFVLVGGALPAYEPLRAQLHALAGEPPLAGRVVFLDEQPRHAIADLIQALDVLVVPTVDMEPFGLVLLEAMALGVPVVATRGGPDDVVLEGETGWLVPPADPGAIAGAVARLLRDPIVARRFGRAGRLRVRTQFAIERHVAEVEAVYRLVTGVSSPAALEQPAVAALPLASGDTWPPPDAAAVST